MGRFLELPNKILVNTDHIVRVYTREKEICIVLNEKDGNKNKVLHLDHIDEDACLSSFGYIVDYLLNRVYI